MSMKHTPEKWHVQKGSAMQILTGKVPVFSDSTPIATVFNSEDADRIVACVNAMAGIPDPIEFMQKIKGSNMVFFEAIELEQKRDELIRSDNDLASGMLKISSDRDRLRDALKVCAEFIRSLKSDDASVVYDMISKIIVQSEGK